MLDKIQIHYQPVEDRLALLIKMKNGDSLNLWLTRRVTQKLLSSLNALVQKDEAVISQTNDNRKAHVQQFQQQQAAEKSQFAKEPVDPKKFAETPTLDLVVDVRLDDKRLRLPMTNGKILNLEISTELAYVVSNLINSSLPQTNWNITPKQQTSSLDYMHQSYPTMTLN